jgi:chemotaxis signal transduction protein
MLRSARTEKTRTESRTCHLLVFSVGGRYLAVKTDEVGGISSWNGSIPVPSRTPFVSAVVRKDDVVLPVFNLAGLLKVVVQGDELLCLTAKQRQGMMAICIDAEMPVLHTLDTSSVTAYRGRDLNAVGSFLSGLDEIPIISLAQLGTA